ncbi:UNVERIFIED_CONTAM: hypothetical protein RMT77_008442 [Armadillidium vulgare]
MNVQVHRLISEKESVTCELNSSKGTKPNYLTNQMVDLDLAATLDREGLSVRQAKATFAAAAKSLGLRADNVPSRSTVYLFRQKALTTIGATINKNISEFPARLLIHWDRKILTDIRQLDKKVERIEVVVTGEGMEELFGVPEILDGTGNQAEKIVRRMLTTVGIENKIIGMVFDTSASNTGIVQGACVQGGISTRKISFMVSLPPSHY